MNSGQGIPFLDLITPHLELEQQLMDAVRGVITSAMFIGGPAVENFEREFAGFCDAKYCVGVNSGTDALRFALMAAGIGHGDIVVTVPNTFAATVEAIIQAGATPQFVDVDPETLNLSVEALRTHLKVHSGERIKAIIPVHLYGQMCEMDPIMTLAEEYGLMVLEDACQAHGSEYFSRKQNRWLKAGSIGRAAAFSFYPGKNLGACGEGGAVTTNDEALAQRIRMIRDHGQNKKYHHLIEGYNGRLDAMQAALLRVKLPHLAGWNENRRAAAEVYNTLLSGIQGVDAPLEPEWSHGIYHLYVVRVQQRDELQRQLTERNVGTGLHYPIPLHLQEAYRHLGYTKGDFPVTEKAADEILSLPMFPHIRREQQQEVVEALAAKAVCR
ncbi:MAG TPA: DegT/DnrJ/EryC1/StrS family aminotransferase [Terriglobia bacterium]|jgi:dTDP-4-amino-4,6-dideoxygalactose transaminase